MDPARDLQRLNTLILSNMTRLNALREKLDNLYSPTMGTHEETKSTLRALSEASISLGQVHRSYLTTLTRDMKYGSYQAPIGDDNYLHMSSFGVAMTSAAAAAAVVAQQHTNPTRSVALYNH